MTTNYGEIIRQLTAQNNELAVQIREALISSGYTPPENKSADIQDYTRSLISAFKRQAQRFFIEDARERRKERLTFIRYENHFIQLGAIRHVEFGRVPTPTGRNTRFARIVMDSGEEIMVRGLQANNLWYIFSKTTGDSDYDIHHLVSVPKGRSVRLSFRKKNEHKKLAKNNKLHSADGERGPDKSGGEAT